MEGEKKQSGSTPTEDANVAIEVTADTNKQAVSKPAAASAAADNNGDDVDYADLTIEEAMNRLNATEGGLSTVEAEKRQLEMGFNEIVHEEIPKWKKFLAFMWNPLSWVMEAAAVVAIVLSNGPTPNVDPFEFENDGIINVPRSYCLGSEALIEAGDQLNQSGLTPNRDVYIDNKDLYNNCPGLPPVTGMPFPPPDYPDFIGILMLLIANATIGYLEESKAGDAVAALMGSLCPKATVKRDGEWKKLEARELVPGDIVTIKLGDIIPADMKVLEGEDLKVDQAGLTGESLPVTKRTGDLVFSSCTVKKGEIDCVVTSTGENTFFGKAASLVAETETKSHLQEVLAAIGNFCMIYIGAWIVIMVIVMYAAWGYAYRSGINMVLVVLIGGIPIAMPTVLSVTMATGVSALAKENAIVTRITAVEVMAGMDILCSDKTGTLTLNQLTVDEPELLEGYTSEDLYLYAALSAKQDGDPDAIDKVSVDTARDANLPLGDWEVTRFVPFDPVSKRTEAWCTHKATGRKMVCSKGAPQVMIDIAHNADEIREQEEKKIDEYAQRGLRALGVAFMEGNEADANGKAVGDWQYVGIMSLSDPPRHDTAETIARALRLGVEVKMITGDQVAIGKDTAQRIGMGTNFHNAKICRQDVVDGIPIGQLIEESDGFGEVFPEDKYRVVKILQDLDTGNGPFGGHHVVGMTGDGVNDAPALKVSDVGIAVDGATDAARASADMVLTTAGLSVIITAITGSRRIFQRMKNYAMYACCTTIRIVTTFGLLTCAWQFQFPPFMVLIIAYLNDGTIITISYDNADPSPHPDAWKLKELFSMGFVLGLWLTISTIVFWVIIIYTDFFDTVAAVPPNMAVKDDTICTYLTLAQTKEDALTMASNTLYENAAKPEYLWTGLTNSQSEDVKKVCVAPFSNGTDACYRKIKELSFQTLHNVVYNEANDCLSAYAVTSGMNRVGRVTNAIIYLQVSITGQLVIFSTRARLFFFQGIPPSWLLCAAFMIAQLAATFLVVYADWPFTAISPIGWGWAAICWVWSIIWFLPLDIFKIANYWILYGNPWESALAQKAAMKLAYGGAPSSKKGPTDIRVSKRVSKLRENASKKGHQERISRASKRGKA